MRITVACFGNRLVEVAPGARCEMWRGETDKGTPVVAFIPASTEGREVPRTAVMTLEPTATLVDWMAGFKCRVWEGVTDAGDSCRALVAFIGCEDGKHRELDDALLELRPAGDKGRAVIVALDEAVARDLLTGCRS